MNPTLAPDAFDLTSWSVKANPGSRPTPVRPFITVEKMERILSVRHSIFSEEAYRQIKAHPGRRLLPGRIKTSVDGRTVWACC